MKTRVAGYVLLAVALSLVALVAYRNIEQSRDALIFSPTQLLGATWENYKTEYLESGSRRTLDKQRKNITTSEGQSYTMLRAVWMGDKETFDISWQWTKDNLQHEEDHLFAWLFGRRTDGTYGVLTDENGNTAASDGDTDIAVALLFAYSRWQDPSYLGDAREIIEDIWEYEIVEIAGAPYHASNNIEKALGNEWILINPSYLHPAAYRIFAEVDPTHPWEEVVDSSYALLNKTVAAALDTGKSAGLPPDWVQVNRETGALRAPESSTLTTNFGYDAMRTPWRIALDHEWHGEPRARSLLQKMQFLSSEWNTEGRLGSTYGHDGSVVTQGETPAMYGGTIGYFMVADPNRAQAVYRDKLEFLFDAGSNGWKQELSYYDDNWAWFGIGLYNDLLPNLTANLPKGALTI